MADTITKELNTALAWLRNGGHSVASGQFLVEHEALIRRAIADAAAPPAEAPAERGDWVLVSRSKVRAWCDLIDAAPAGVKAGLADLLTAAPAGEAPAMWGVWHEGEQRWGNVVFKDRSSLVSHEVDGYVARPLFAASAGAFGCGNCDTDPPCRDRCARETLRAAMPLPAKRATEAECTEAAAKQFYAEGWNACLAARAAPAAPAEGSGTMLFVHHAEPGDLPEFEWCHSEDDVRRCVEKSCWMTFNPKDANEVEERDGIVASLLRHGRFDFEGDPPLQLLRAPRVTGGREVETLREALADLISWFPAAPAPAEWRIPAGGSGADDAIVAAHAALGHKTCRFCGWRGAPETAADPYTTDGTVEVCGGCNNAESCE